MRHNRFLHWIVLATLTVLGVTRAASCDGKTCYTCPKSCGIIVTGDSCACTGSGCSAKCTTYMDQEKLERSTNVVVRNDITGSGKNQEKKILRSLKSALKARQTGSTEDVCDVTELNSYSVNERFDGAFRLAASTYLYQPTSDADVIVLDFCGTHPCDFKQFSIKVGCQSKDLDVFGVEGNLIGIVGDVSLCSGPQESSIPPFFRSAEVLGLIYNPKPTETDETPMVIYTQNTRDIQAEINLPSLGLSITKDNGDWTVTC